MKLARQIRLHLTLASWKPMQINFYFAFFSFLKNKYKIKHSIKYLVWVLFIMGMNLIKKRRLLVVQRELVAEGVGQKSNCSWPRVGLGVRLLPDLAGVVGGTRCQQRSIPGEVDICDAAGMRLNSDGVRCRQKVRLGRWQEKKRQFENGHDTSQVSSNLPAPSITAHRCEREMWLTVKSLTCQERVCPMLSPTTTLWPEGEKETQLNSIHLSLSICNGAAIRHAWFQVVIHSVSWPLLTNPTRMCKF